MAKPANPLPLALAIFGSLGLAWSLCADAEEAPAPVTRLYSASDFPQLARGVELPADGRYTIKVWAPTRQEWSVAADGTTLTLASKTAGDDETPRWQVAGEATIRRDEPVKIVVAPPPAKTPAEATPKKTEPAKKKEEAKPVVVPRPALLAITNVPDAVSEASLDLIRGRVDSVAPPADPRRQKVRSNQEGADFHAPATPQAWRDRARAVRQQVLVAAGLWPMFPKTPLNPRVFDKVERDGYTIEKVVLETFPGFTLSGNLYRPVGKAGRLPGLLCPHGHWEDGRTNPEVQQRCIRWAKLGCVVFMYDMVGYNDSKPFGHAFLNDRLRRWGLSLVTLQTWDTVRALDWLTTLPDVDPARIGCTGESGGGTQTFLITAIDDRIKVAAPIVMVSDTFQGGCVCENAAGLRHGTDNVEFAALTAPRPLKLVGASGDWTAKTMTRAFPRIRDVYALVGSPERVSADVFDFPHNYNQTTRNAVYAFMARWLLGIDDADSTREGEQTPEKAEALRTFNDRNPAPSDRKTAAQLESDLVRVLGEQVESLRPADGPAAWQASRELLRTSHRVRVGLVNPPPAELEAAEVRRIRREGLTVIHSVVGRRSVGERIPVVRLIPAHPTGRLTVVATAHGKERLVTPEGQPSPLVKALLDRGQSVVGYDPLLVGESLDPAAPASRRPDTRHFETYNPALAGDQIQDLATVLAWARSQPDVLEVSLVGQGWAGPQVLLARPALEGLARTAVDLHEFDPGDGSGEYPAGLDLPGLLQFGGLNAAAALTSPAPLWIHRAGDAFTAAWPEKAFALDDASHVLKLSSGRARDEDIARWIDTGE